LKSYMVIKISYLLEIGGKLRNLVKPYNYYMGLFFLLTEYGQNEQATTSTPWQMMLCAVWSKILSQDIMFWCGCTWRGSQIWKQFIDFDCRIFQQMIWVLYVQEVKFVLTCMVVWCIVWHECRVTRQCTTLPTWRWATSCFHHKWPCIKTEKIA
jgi:hypothetical protein